MRSPGTTARMANSSGPDEPPVLLRRDEHAAHIARRPAARVTPSLQRSSVEAYAPVLAEQQAQDAHRHHQAQLQREAARIASGPPQDGQVWLTVPTTALLMELLHWGATSSA